MLIKPPERRQRKRSFGSPWQHLSDTFPANSYAKCKNDANYTTLNLITEIVTIRRSEHIAR
jgi:hypothetical protein